MTKYMICTLMLLSLQTARAEEVQPPADATTVENTEDAPKSFFETRTLQDMQQIATVDANLLPTSVSEE